VPLRHHELCFGCGRTNLFGLMLELEPEGAESVKGRCFIKQDHQGADRGTAHEGAIGAALSEAMALACGPQARARRLELEIVAPPPVGVFLDVEAWLEGRCGELVQTAASAEVEGETVARARGSYSARRPA
jgi:acyl-coenzyme A thioesterase PaaI-like protein